MTRYSLSNIVQKSSVTSVTWDPPSSTFTLQSSTGPKRAKVVVFAAGAATKPSLPPDSPFSNLNNLHDSVFHAFTSPHPAFLPLRILAKIKARKQTSIAVIGGGLSSAQVTHLATTLGVTKVYHLIRSSLKVKHFDVDLSWVGKYKNFHLASFWSADSDQERMGMVREARGGGSVNPEYEKVLMRLLKEGRVEIREGTRVVGALWDEECKVWELEMDKGERVKVDVVVYATGVPADLQAVGALRPLLHQAPLETVGGLPCLTNDLMWDEDIPFFFTGRMASLRLGPAAPNLEGARQGAERIAWKVGELLEGGYGGSDGGYASEWSGEDEVDRRRLGLGCENQFGILGLSDDK
ncbi:hypothetical protein LAWI1_G008842 [Lachnellula willkommii]|uniref:FAD/NAD(P)-binding domain-containing protein n=1 Tax=Lachnellula willkommii TaxID=215461 RepID=A0A559M083_9HELO|nr:hypothetical protein LAWI1_G008842 [Lachnellula willkommii]